MTAELAKIKSFLPQSVLAQLYGDMSDEGDIRGSITQHSESHHASESHLGTSALEASASVLASSSSMHPSSGGRTGNSHTHAAGLNTSMRLTTRKVTMLCLNVLGFHKHAHRRSTEDLVRQHARIVKAVSEACSEYRGVMDGFQGDRFTISFNAVTHAASHAVLAAEAALAISEVVSAKLHLHMSSGIASGAAMVGNMGSATTKRFTVVSPVVSSAVLLERLSKRYGSSSSPLTLVAGSALQDIELMFEMLTMDAVLLPTIGGGVRRATVCAVMAPREAAADEWMYEVQEGDKNSQYGGVNEAFRMFMEGMVCEAGKSVASQLQATSSRPSEASNQVSRVLRFLEGLVARANSPRAEGGGGGGEGAMEYGRNYVNTLHDYYSKCALPTGDDTHVEDLH